MAEQSVNIPQVFVFLLVTFLAVRWYFSKPSATGAAQARANPRAARVDISRVNDMAAMFPQVDRRDLAWDLQRNGGNVSATTERVLSGRGLDRAPPSFTIPPLRAAAPSGGAARPAASAPKHPDLITRYNLTSKLEQTSEPAQEEKQKQKAWSQDRNERQANLQKRREEMILAARRKLEEKERVKSAAA